ncbi:MAG: SpoIID/LytB domain-containing protein [Acidobacteria bacterium]|nr:SpoIID/LytB domain-containing protein [Acidobacteriota bacterium]
MPVPTRMHTQAVARVAAVVAVTSLVSAQGDVTDAQLEALSRGRVVRVGPAAGGRGPVIELPLEVYVARVLAGEGEPRAAEAAQQALAIAIRTYALANAGRHAREGFDLCDGTHCQVPRTATAASRRATLATAGQLLTYSGAPAELFYSASCGGYSESAGEVWPGLSYPYLVAAPDDVHADDAPWMLELTIAHVQRSLERVGFDGRLRDVRVDERSASGRAARLQLPGLFPDVIAGDQFRAALGTTVLRSTAFTIERRGSTLRFTGRGYGHGVGMCVIGAGRRAERGENAQAILARYYPGLVLTQLAGSAAAGSSAPRDPAYDGVRRAGLAERTIAGESDPPRAAGRASITVEVPSVSSVDAAEVERLTAAAHDALGRTLGVSVAPMTLRIHASLESFRQATGRPWWVSSVADGTSIDLVPAPLLAQREGVESAIRTAVAELLVAPALAERPRWVRVGAARYFARGSAPPAADARRDIRCPSDAELTLAISAPAQRDAEARAEACFARAYARTREWKSVR